MNLACLLKDHQGLQDLRVSWVLQVYKAPLDPLVTLARGVLQDVLVYQGLMVYLVLLVPC